MLKVTHQGEALGTNSDIYHCLDFDVTRPLSAAWYRVDALFFRSFFSIQTGVYVSSMQKAGNGTCGTIPAFCILLTCNSTINVTHIG